jgi:hypothetical protein
LYLDLQPRNALFDKWGTVHLVDFDTAVPLGKQASSDLAHREMVVYVAPEVTDGRDLDERADLYSLGATIYETASGHPPFAGSREEIVEARRARPAPPLERDDLPAALRDLVSRLLESDREQRPASANDVVERLKGISATRAEIERLLASDESAALEFKSSLRVPIGPLPEGMTKKRLEQALEFSVLKTLAAFLNSQGGILIVGVDDHEAAKVIVGIEVDYPRLQEASRDGWCRVFDDLVSRDLGGEVLEHIDLHLEPWEGKTIAVIRCTPRRGPTWLKDDLYIRRTATTENLHARHAIDWWLERFN